MRSDNALTASHGIPPRPAVSGGDPFVFGAAGQSLATNYGTVEPVRRDLFHTNSAGSNTNFQADSALSGAPSFSVPSSVAKSAAPPLRTLSLGSSDSQKFGVIICTWFCPPGSIRYFSGF